MQKDNSFNSTYKQLWPDLNSATKVQNQVSNTSASRYSNELRYSSIQPIKPNTSVEHQQCNIKKPPKEESLLRNQKYQNSFAVLNPSICSASNIFNEPIVLCNKSTRLSYTGNFSSFGNQTENVRFNHEINDRDSVGQVCKQTNLIVENRPVPFSSLKHLSPTPSVDHSYNVESKEASYFKVAELEKDRKSNYKKSNARTITTVQQVQTKKSEFSLEEAEHDFPELNTLKRQKNNKNLRLQEHNNSETGNANVPINKGIAKSWKPKIKDPIFIDLDQALHSLPEKNKSEPKKISATKQVPLPANILDSDKPKQRKGKVRPDKLKKPSKLKERILEIRSEKHNLVSDKSLTNIEITVDDLEKSVSSICVKSDAENDVEDSNDAETIATDNCEIVTNIDKEVTISEIKPKQENINFVNIHSRRFREYCTNCITEDLVTNVCALLEKVAQFQDRTFAQNPLKASAKRRYVAGIHQSNKYLNVKKVKLFVIAPDLEKNPGKGGLDDKITNMIQTAESQEIPCVFGPNRKRLGRSVRKSALVACIAVLSFEGAEEQFHKVSESLRAAKDKYQAMTRQHSNSSLQKQDDIPENIPEQTVEEGMQKQTEDVTYTLLAKLRENLSPAEQLLRAINPRDW